MKLVHGLDYYIENGKWVFTEHFLKTRPCCKNGCRHCPYGYKRPQPPPKTDAPPPKYGEGTNTGGTKPCGH